MVHLPNAITKNTLNVLVLMSLASIGRRVSVVKQILLSARSGLSTVGWTRKHVMANNGCCNTNDNVNIKMKTATM